jgi:hypothetical protein
VAHPVRRTPSHELLFPLTVRRPDLDLEAFVQESQGKKVKKGAGLLDQTAKS